MRLKKIQLSLTIALGPYPESWLEGITLKTMRPSIAPDEWSQHVYAGRLLAFGYGRLTLDQIGVIS